MEVPPSDESATNSPAGSTLATSTSSASSNQGDEAPLIIYCKWKGCSSTYEDPEDLYVHLCNDHVGRKSTNNLCLTCRWEDCDAKCAKRDHITSHLRVHTPLKPHACESCGKLFKRPQDLKKHERIHTEQHLQSRQTKFQASTASASAYPSYPHSGGVAWPSSQKTDHTSSLYPSSQSYRSDQAGLYPSLPASGQGFYRSAPRDITPTYVVDSASVASSLSPMSSHIATPASSSPAAPHTRASAPQQTSPHDRGYLTMENDRPRGSLDDPNSYSYLAQGSSLAGSKRGHDAVATASFFDDIRRKRITPTYDMAMAERFEDTFAHGIDDDILQALFSSFQTGLDRVDSSFTASNATAPAPSHSVPLHSRMSLPDAFKQTDLADLNAFLLQMGASAARDESAHGPSSSAFDFAAALNTYGLDNVPGFDESLLQWPQDNHHHQHHQQHSSAPVYSTTMDTQWTPSTSAFGQRPIAHLPQRNGAIYPSIPQHQQPTYQPVPNGYNPLGMPAASFDSLRAARGTAFVPQLGPKEMNGSLYRHIEALTRAKPMEQEAGEIKSYDKRSSGSFSTSSMTHVSSGDPSRRLPSPTSHERGLGSIASILDSPVVSRSETTNYSSSSSSSSSPTSSHGESSSSSPTLVYPRLGGRRQNSINDIEDDVAAMGVASPTTTVAAVPMRVRHNHAKIVLDLLMAINFPNRNSVKLPPIKVAPSTSPSSDDDIDMSRTPTMPSPPLQGGDEEQEDQRSTPKLDTARRLPHIASLLNDVDAKKTPLGGRWK